MLSSVPPIDARPEAAARLNADLGALAEARGWTWVDASAGVRAGGRFADGMSVDGLHPTAEGAAELGAALRKAVLAVEAETHATTG